MTHTVPSDHEGLASPEHTSQTPTIGGRDATRIAVASAIAAGSSFVVVVVSAKVLLPAENNALFQIFWAALFACFGVLSGVSIETTRAVAAAGDPTTASSTAVPPARRPRVLVVGAGIGLMAGAVIALSVSLWAPHVFTRHAWALGALVALGVAGYAVHSVLVGALAGRRAWRPYSVLIGAESTVRLLLIVVVAVVGGRVLGFAAGAACAAFTWVVLLLLSPQVRQVAPARADSNLPVFLRRLGSASIATGASAMLVVGFPVLLGLTSSSEVIDQAAPFLMAITLTRAPLMIPLNAYQGVAVTHFVEHRDRGLRAMLPAARAVVAVGVVGAALAAVIGPWLLRLLSHDDYRVSGTVMGALVLAAILLALLTLTGALCQALTMHSSFVAGWVAALAVSFLILLLPVPIETRGVLALAGGPAAGIVIHLVALRRRTARERSRDTEAAGTVAHPTAPGPTADHTADGDGGVDGKTSVSVCIATYNGEQFITDQLRSILAQLGPHDEVVVVDDASTDATTDRVRGIDDARVRLVEAPLNRGYVRTFEAALGLARGQYILLSDQDDVWTPGRVSVMVEALKTVDVVATNLATLDGPDRIKGPYGQSDWHLRAAQSRRHVGNILGTLAGNRPYYGCAMGVRRSALDTILPFPDFLVESHDLWIALYGNLAKSIRHDESRSLRRRFHADNASPDRPRGLSAVLRSRMMLVRVVMELRRRR